MSRLTDLIFFRNSHVCPRWLCFTFDNALRRLIHKPEKIVSGYIREGDVVLDVGAGIGYFTIPMAKIVGHKGRVIAADLQKSMLDGISKRAVKSGLEGRIVLRQSRSDSLNVGGKFNFILVFWMAHEVPNLRRFMGQLSNVLNNGGKLLLVEPKFHVSNDQFAKIMETGRQAGLVLTDQPSVALSRAALFSKR